MRKSSPFPFVILFVLTLASFAQAKTRYEIDGAPTRPLGPVVQEKSAKVAANLEIITLTGPATASQGDNLAPLVTAAFRNAGPEDITTQFSVYLSLSDTIGGRPTGDRRIGSRLFLNGLVAAVDSVVAWSQLLIPLTYAPGDYHLVFELDPLEEIGESNELDNNLSIPITITESIRTTVFFEDFQGGAAGWTPVDITAQIDIYVNRIDYDDGIVTRGVWWCGTTNPGWWVDSQGYGNRWDQRLEKDFVLPAGPCSVDFVLQYDTEPTYDYVYVDISNTNGESWETLTTFDGVSVGFENHNLDITSYAGQAVRIRFRFSSDSGYSDEDGSYLSDGAFRLDEVSVTGSPTDDFEIDGNGWTPSYGEPLGGAWRLEDSAYCPPGWDCDNYTSGDPGTFCNAWVAYDPATLEFPDSTPEDHSTGRNIDIAINSPWIDISAVGPGDILELTFDLFAGGLTFENGVFYYWNVIDNVDNIWRSQGFIYYSSRGWITSRFDITDLVADGATSLVIQLGATDSGWRWGHDPSSHESVPYFDNVGLQMFNAETPAADHPDPRFCGWTAGDTDADGVPDASDACPGESARYFDRDGDGCLDPVIGGRHIEYWADGTMPLTYVIHETGVPTITDGSDLQAVQDGFNAWLTVPGTDVAITYGGTTPNGNANALDLVNTVTFADPDYAFPTGVLAVGLSTSYLTTAGAGAAYRPGQIIDTDMIFNPAVQFRTDTMGTGTHIKGVVTHEAGHMLGLSHSAVLSSTMFYVLPPFNPAVPLREEDKQAILKAYPDPTTLATASHLRGVVSNGYDGEPVAGAIVYAIEALPGDALGDTLGCEYTLPMDGSYHFLGLPDGDYFIGIQPLNGSSAIGFIQPGNINQMILTSAETVFLAEFYDSAESSMDVESDRTPLTVQLGVTTTADLITNVDVTGPTVLATAPMDGAVDIPVNTALLVKFSEPMDPNSFQGNFRYRPLAGGDGVQGNAALASDDSTLMFVPISHLDFSTEYQVLVLPEVADLFGNTMGDSVEIRFTTEVQPAVYIESLVPSRAIAGSPVMINGAGFHETPGLNQVTFGGVSSPVIEGTTDNLVVNVPEGIDPGQVEIIVTNPAIGSYNAFFHVLEAEDVARGHEIATVDLPSLPGKVLSSPDGAFAYVATGTGLAVVDMTDRAAPGLYFQSFPDGVDDLGVSPGGGSIFAISTDEKMLRRFRFDSAVVGTGNPVILENEIGLADQPLGLRVGPTGQRAYIASESGQILIWDIALASPTFEQQIGVFDDVDSDLLGDLEINPAGTRLFALSGTGKLKVFDLLGSTLAGEVDLLSSPVDVTIDPAGQFAYITDGAGYLTIVELASLLKVADIQTGGDLRGAAVTPAGSFVYAANHESDNLDVIDLRVGTPTYRNVVTRIPARVDPVDLVFSPDGVFAYSLVEDELKFVISAMGSGPVLGSMVPASGPAGAKVVLAGSGFLGSTVTINGTAAVVEQVIDTAMTIVVPGGATSGPLTVVGAVPGEVSNSLTFNVLEPAPTGSLRLAAELTPAGSPGLEPLLAVSPVGGQTAVAASAGDVLLLDTRPGSPTYHQFTAAATPFAVPVTGMAFSPDGATVYAIAPGSPFMVILDAAFGNATYGQLLNLIPVSFVSPGGLAVSPDGSRLLVADPGSGGVWIVDPVLGTTALSAIGEGAVGAMSFHPGGLYAYLAVDPMGVVVLDLADPAAPGYGSVIPPGASLAEVPLSVAFTPDGSECYLLTSLTAGSTHRSVMRLNTTDPTAPTDSTTVGNFPTFAVPGTESLALSPVGDHAVVNIDGDGLFQAELAPWSSSPTPEHPLISAGLGTGYGREGRSFYVADPGTDTVLLFDFLGVQQMVTVWGNGQTGVVDEALASTLRVRIVDQNGTGSPEVPVTFSIVSGGGNFPVAGDPAGTTVLTAATNLYGYAQTPWILGSVPGIQEVQVVSQGVTGSPRNFTATAIADPEPLPLELVNNLLAPAADAVGVSVTTAIQSVFTKAVDPQTIYDTSFLLFNLTDEVLVQVAYGFSDQNRRVSMTPTEPLDFDKVYQVAFTSAIRTPGAANLSNPASFFFTTESPPAGPSLSAISPPSAAVVVSLVLSGSGFDPVPSNNKVLFPAASGGAPIEANITGSATDHLTAQVPVLAGSGPVFVETQGQQTNSLPFTVLVPTTASPDDVIRQVPTGSAAKSVTVSPDGALAYAVSPVADLLIPLDLANLVTLPGIPVGDEPWAVSVHPDGTYAYVANRASGDVTIVDVDPLSGSFHQIQAFVPVGNSPVDLVVSPTGDRVYVANGSSNDLSVIDADETSATFNNVINSPTVGRPTKAVTVSPDGGRVYVGTDDGYLVLESAEFGIIAARPTGKATKSVTVSPDGALLIMVTNRGTLSVFDVAPGSPSENQVLSQTNTGRPIKSVTVSPDGALLMVVYETGSIIDIFALDVGTSVGAQSPDANIDPMDLTLVDSIEAGENPQDVAFDPSGSGNFVVTNAGDNTMSVFGLEQPVSVMLTGFVGASAESSVKLSWSVNVAARGFILERRVLGADPNWQRVHEGLIPAAVSVNGREFAFEDTAARIGTEYEYRLTSVGENNEETVLGLTQVKYEGAVPSALGMSRNYPNPFNPVTKFNISVPAKQEVKVRVYDLSGRLVAEVHGGVMEAGVHVLAWDGRNRDGGGVASGVYFVRMEAVDFHKTMKVLLLK